MKELHIDKEVLDYIKRTTSGYTGGFLLNDNSINLQNYKEIRESFNSTCQNLVIDTPFVSDYLDKLIKIRINPKKIDNFLQQNPIIKDRLQIKNILLDPNIWHYLVETPKRSILNKAQLVKQRDKNAMYYSELFSISNEKKFGVMILRITTFKSPDLNKSIKPISSNNVDILIYNNDINGLTKLSEDSKNFDYFSIHEYLLPGGLDNLDKAVLLYRYDSLNNNHTNYYEEINSQKGYPESQQYIPNIYKLVYSPEISESHFHFCEGVANLYKLKLKKDNYGDGYAISVSELIKYLEKLNNNKYENDIEKSIYLNNDFGMPFRHFPLKKGNEILEQLKEMQNDPANFIKAYKVFDLIDNCQERNISLIKNNEPEEPEQ